MRGIFTIQYYLSLIKALRQLVPVGWSWNRIDCLQNLSVNACNRGGGANQFIIIAITILHCILV